MSNVTARHPEHGLLLRYADGDLDPTGAGEVSAHLADCAECREWLAEVEAGVAEYKNTWIPALQETAERAQWADLHSAMEALDRKGEPLKFARHPSLFRKWPQWATAAAAAIMIVVAGYWFSGQPMSAAELLQRAVDREQAREQAATGPRPSIRVATRAGSIVRPALWRSSERRMIPAAAQSQAESLRMLFEEAHYSWEDPLSARSFSAWRQTLPERQDQVTKQRGSDGAGSYIVSTSTPSGALAEVRLALRASDLHAVSGTLQFRNNERVEISEIRGAAPSPAKSATQVAGAPVPAPPAPAVASEEPVTPGEELRVWAALRRIDADLGEPITVERDSSAKMIVVAALGLSADRRRVLEAGLSGLPRVDLRFRDPQPVRQSVRTLPVDPGNQAPPLQPTLESELGGRTEAEEFTNRILEASESCLARVHALRELAQHFPSNIETQLTAEDRVLLGSLLGEHASALRMAWGRVLIPARQIVTLPAGSPRLTTQSWQEHAQRLVTAGERSDRVLTNLLAIPGSPANRNTLSELASTLAQFDAEIASAEPVLRSSH
jgi:hypothetical protein